MRRLLIALGWIIAAPVIWLVVVFVIWPLGYLALRVIGAVAGVAMAIGAVVVIGATAIFTPRILMDAYRSRSWGGTGLVVAVWALIGTLIVAWVVGRGR